MRIKFLPMFIVLLALCAPSAFAKKHHKVQAPTVDQALQLRLWRAQAQLDQAQLALTNSPIEKEVRSAQTELQAAMDAWKQVCGTGYHPADSGTNLICAKNPDPARTKQNPKH